MAGVTHLDPTNPEDLAKLIATGLIWNPTIPARFKDLAVDALAEGRVEPNDLIPSDALDEVNTLRQRMGMAPLELAGAPGEGAE